MIHDVVSCLGSALWPVIGLLLFFFVFIAIIIWTYRGRKDRFAYESRLPLDDGATIENHVTGKSAPETSEPNEKAP